MPGGFELLLANATDRVGLLGIGGDGNEFAFRILGPFGFGGSVVAAVGTGEGSVVGNGNVGWIGGYYPFLKCTLAEDKI